MIEDIQAAAEKLMEASHNLDPNANEYSKYNPFHTKRQTGDEIIDEISFLRDPDDEDAGHRLIKRHQGPQGVSAWIEAESFRPGQI